MIRSLVLVFSLYLTCSTHSVGCMDDFDLDAKDRQGYNYPIPHSNESSYWKEDITPEKVKTVKGNGRVMMFWNRNFYIFGKFLDESTGEETTISAGLYRGKELIYKTVINCDSGTWENWVLNKKNNRKEVLLRGDIQKNLTSCKAGDNFDLILKNDNRRLANWIFNAQALQHDVEGYSRKIKKTIVGEKSHSLGHNVRPAVKVYSKYTTFAATRFEFTATGRAVFSRLAFGQCNAWPKNMDMQCQKVRDWMQHRSKANFSYMSVIGFRNSPDENFTTGLGVFGNNLMTFIPDCLTDKYFNFLQMKIHANKFVPLERVVKVFLWKDDNGKDIYRNGTAPNVSRALCCCTNMTTGRVLDDDEKENCIPLNDCVDRTWTCQQAFDPDIGREIEKTWRENDEAYEQGLKNGNGIFVANNAGVKTHMVKDKNPLKGENGVYF